MKRKKLLSAILLAGILIGVIMIGCKSDVEGESQILANEISESEEGCESDISGHVALVINDIDITSNAYVDAVNYKAVLDEISIPDIERIENITAYNTDFPIELQDAVLISIKEGNYSRESLEQYKAEYQLFCDNTLISDDEFDTFPQINEILDVGIGNDELKSPSYIIPIDLNGDGEDEYLVETYYGEPYLAIIVKEEENYALAGIYYHTAVPLVVEVDKQKYVIIDNMIVTMDDSNVTKEWETLTLHKTVCEYKPLEIYSLARYEDTDILDGVSINELLEGAGGKIVVGKQTYYYSSKSILTIDLVHEGYDKTITIWEVNEDGQMEIVKVYLLVANLEVEMMQEEQAYLLCEEQEYIY